FVERNGQQINLLTAGADRNHLILYVTLIMDIVYIDANQIVKLDKAVRSRFKLNKKQLAAESPRLHECFLQKRRNLIKIYSQQPSTPKREKRSCTPRLKRWDDLAAYNQLPNLRIYGVKKEPQKNTDQTVIGICASIDVVIPDEHISVSHRIGRNKNGRKCRATVVRFVHWRTRQFIPINKKQLDRNISISEDLALTNLTIFKYARLKVEKKQVYMWNELVMYNDGIKRICLNSTGHVNSSIDGKEDED
ncbi:unnamed protein product, partial [Didymodactylos carnosus]